MSSDSFTSQKNKGMVWNLLLNNNIFNGMTNDEQPNIMNIFENNFNYFNLINDNLINKNKMVLKKIIDDINKYKKHKQQIEQARNKKKNEEQEEINKKLLKRELSEDLSEKASQHEENLRDLISKPIPQEIDFSDNAVEHEKNVDELLNRAIKERELEIKDLSGNLNALTSNTTHIDTTPIHTTPIDTTPIDTTPIVDTTSIVDTISIENTLTNKILPDKHSSSDKHNSSDKKKKKQKQTVKFKDNIDIIPNIQISKNIESVDISNNISNTELLQMILNINKDVELLKNEISILKLSKNNELL